MTDYNISAGLAMVEVLHLGKAATIQREQNPACLYK